MTRSGTPAAAESQASLAVADLPSFLLAAGLLHPAQVTDGGIVVRDLSRRHRNFAVLLPGGAGLFVKQGVGHDRRRLVAAEASIHRLLAGTGPVSAVAALPPRFRHHDPDQGILVLELLHGYRSLNDAIARLVQTDDPPLALRGYGAAVGSLHALDVRAVGADTLPPFYPFAFQILRPTLRSLRETSAADIEVIRIVQQSIDLRDPIGALEEAWDARRLIHGDLRWDNCRVRDGRSALDCRLVDWETAGLGPPWWDFGSLIAEALTAWLSSAPLSKTLPPEQFLAFARVPLDRLHAPLRALWAGYRQSAPLPDATAYGFLLQSMRAAAARLVQGAYERLQRAQRLSTEAVYLLQLAANLFRSPAAGLELVGLAVS